MQVEVNLLGVVLAAVAGMLVGSVWYAPGAFGKRWARLASVDLTRKVAAGETARIFAVAFAISLLTAYVLAHISFVANYFYRNSFLVDAVMTSTWIWLGLVAVRFWLHDLFEGRKGQLTLLTAGHEFATLIIMALVLGLFKP